MSYLAGGVTSGVTFGVTSGVTSGVISGMGLLLLLLQASIKKAFAGEQAEHISCGGGTATQEEEEEEEGAATRVHLMAALLQYLR